MAVVQPPRKQEWMAVPQGITGCPPGLEYLMQIDQIIIKQEVHLLEVLTGWEVANKFQILNSMGQQIYYACEESTCLMRQCCGPGRGFKMHVTDNNQREVIAAERRFKCCAGCCWCANSDTCAYEMPVEAPIGTECGYIRQEFSKWSPHIKIYDHNREPVFDIWGPCCPCQGICCTADIDFKVYSVKDGQETPIKIFKRWAGVARELFADADTFGVTFPMDLDVRMKATLFGAVFMIDILYFETQNQNNN